MAQRLLRFCAEILFAFAIVVGADAQLARGELRIDVHDPEGAAVPATAELVSEGNQFRRIFFIEGQYAAQAIPFGIYRLGVNARGFAPSSQVIEVRSEVPVHVT